MIARYKEDLIVLTGNSYGEVPNKILNIGEHQAEESLLWWKEQFGEDLYIELMRHGQEDENQINKVLLQFAKRNSVKTVATQTIPFIWIKKMPMHTIFCCV